MGADGGLNWFNTRDPKRFRELTSFMRLEYQGDTYHSSDHDILLESDYNFGPNPIFGEYGTGCNNQGMQELFDILWQIEDRKELFEDNKYTFRELLEDRETYSTHSYEHENLHFYLDPQPFSMMCDIIYREKPDDETLEWDLESWYCEITRLIISYGVYETWT